jgi:hypothetical protein
LLERSSFSCLYVIIEATISLYQQQSNGTEVNQHILYDNHRTRANWFDNRLGLLVVRPIRNSTCQRTEVSDETAVKQRWSDWQLESVPSLVTDDESTELRCLTNGYVVGHLIWSRICRQSGSAVSVGLRRIIPQHAARRRSITKKQNITVTENLTIKQ